MSTFQANAPLKASGLIIEKKKTQTFTASKHIRRKYVVGGNAKSSNQCPQLNKLEVPAKGVTAKGVTAYKIRKSGEKGPANLWIRHPRRTRDSFIFKIHRIINQKAHLQRSVNLGKFYA